MRDDWISSVLLVVTVASLAVAIFAGIMALVT